MKHNSFRSTHKHSIIHDGESNRQAKKGRPDTWVSEVIKKNLIKL